jgi:hypothetical protein
LDGYITDVTSLKEFDRYPAEPLSKITLDNHAWSLLYEIYDTNLTNSLLNETLTKQIEEINQFYARDKELHDKISNKNNYLRDTLVCHSSNLFEIAPDGSIQQQLLEETFVSNNNCRKKPLYAFKSWNQHST